MKKMSSPVVLAVAAAIALLASCASPSKITTPSATAAIDTRSPGAGPGGSAAAGTTAGVTPQSGVSTVNLGPAGAGGAAGGAALLAAPSQRIVYFDFDSFAIKDEYKGLLDSHAKVLAREGGRRLVIEGHTDDRGGREYNLALGQKRAESVVKSLSLLGVPERQLEAVSFGEERPAATGNDESAWSRNRRAELKDR